MNSPSRGGAGRDEMESKAENISNKLARCDTNNYSLRPPRRNPRFRTIQSRPERRAFPAIFADYSQVGFDADHRCVCDACATFPRKAVLGTRVTVPQGGHPLQHHQNRRWRVSRNAPARGHGSQQHRTAIHRAKLAWWVASDLVGDSQRFQDRQRC